MKPIRGFMIYHETYQRFPDPQGNICREISLLPAPLNLMNIGCQRDADIFSALRMALFCLLESVVDAMTSSQLPPSSSLLATLSCSKKMVSGM